jgi:hypothetical protein
MQGDQDMPRRIQANDQRQHAQQREQRPRPAGHILGGKGRHEPEDAHHDQLDAEQHRDHQ